jgi:uncharacterized membrane protein YfcA
MEALFSELGLSSAQFAILFGTVFLGALVQGAIGFGLNLIVVPALAAFRPEALPAAAVMLAIPMTFGSAVRERAHIDRSAVLWATLGRLPGIALGVWIVKSVDDAALARLSGGMVLLAVAMSVATARLAITPVSQLVAGWLGGVMGTASSIGGPPLALLYQHSPGPVVRATLGAAFLVGTTLTLLSLIMAGEVQVLDWRMAGALVPAVPLGLLASRALHGWLERGWLRPCVLALCATAGLGVLLHGLFPSAPL